MGGEGDWESGECERETETEMWICMSRVFQNFNLSSLKLMIIFNLTKICIVTVSELSVSFHTWLADFDFSTKPLTMNTPTQIYVTSLCKQFYLFHVSCCIWNEIQTFCIVCMYSFITIQIGTRLFQCMYINCFIRLLKFNCIPFFQN